MMRQSSITLRRALVRRTLVPAWIATGIAATIAPSAQATPVYLRLDSLFPSGHYQRQWLEGKTEKVQFQRWLRVKTPNGVYGWLPEDHLLTPLKLATEAITTEDVPARAEMQMDALTPGAPLIPKGTRALVLEVQGSWVHTHPLGPGDLARTWIPSESLRAHANAQTEKIFIPGRAPVFAMPAVPSRLLGELKKGSYALINRPRPHERSPEHPLHNDTRARRWIEVPFRGGVGFVRREDTIVLSDVGDARVFASIEGAPLRSAPLPYADLVTNLSRRTTLSVLERKTQRWGQARVPDTGDLWWMISDDFDENARPSRAQAKAETILTSELFARKIFDMASSRAIPQLKFASANGVFRTLDGQEWTRIQQFRNDNHPIAVANEGEVFVGPYLSEDHGETFQSWIRWDSLIATIKRYHSITPKTLRIIEIHPQDAAGRRVALRLSIGTTKISTTKNARSPHPPQEIRVLTEDQGQTWKAM